jgi:hypothetical protein
MRMNRSGSEEQQGTRIEWTAHGRLEVGAAMAQIYPFHSTVGSDRAVHHDNAGCEEARAIPRENRRDGTGGRPKCERCEQLDRADG